jgi:hypothetical protein
MKGYVVVFEGDDESGYSAYSPDLPGVIAAGDSRQDTETLMIEAGPRRDVAFQRHDGHITAAVGARASAAAPPCRWP